MFKYFRKTEPRSSGESLDDIELYIKDIPGAVGVVDRFPRVDWEAVREAAKPYTGHPAVHQLWTELGAQWLGIVSRHLGVPYQLYESRHLLLLSPESPDRAAALLKVGDTAYERLEAMLGRSEEQRGHGKHAVLLFPGPEVYLDYVSFFHSQTEGYFAMSGGTHVSGGYRHTAINGSRSSHQTLVHELAHDMVWHLPLPTWLNEGLAQFAEEMAGVPRRVVDRREARLQRRYWSWHGLTRFWNGRAFFRVSSQRLSYQLANVLFRNLVHHPTRRRRLKEFLLSADRRDAGASSCERCFGCPLGTLVEQFLGEGPWEPIPENEHRSD